MTIDFSKYEGVGNDMIIVDDLDGAVTLTREAIAAACDRHFGVGADGLIFLRRGSRAPWRMEFYNPDGSRAEMCGNGIRCLARHIWDDGLSSDDALLIETAAGVKEVRSAKDVGAAQQVTVSMGHPGFSERDVPVESDSEPAQGRLTLDGTTYEVMCVSMGNPHCVVFVDRLEDIDVAESGPVVERMSCFPERTNVEFTQVTGPDEIKVGVWERGAGETLACGTGACAAAVASAHVGRTWRRVRVHLPGGTLAIDWQEDGEVLLTGPARRVFVGRMEVL